MIRRVSTSLSIALAFLFAIATDAQSCSRQQAGEYSDGTYSAASITCGLHEKGSCERFLKDVEDGKVRHIGELKCYEKNGNFRIHKNLISPQFRSSTP